MLIKGIISNPSSAEDGGLHTLAIEWHELPPPGPPAPADGGWLVLAEEDDAVANALAGALGAALLAAPLSLFDTGAHVVRRHLTAGHRHVVMLCPDPAGGVGADGIERARDRVRRLIDLVRTLTATGRPPRLYVITRQACTAPRTPPAPGVPSARGVPAACVLPSGCGAPCPEQASLGAVCRVAAAEHPELRIAHVDAEAGGDPAGLAAELLADPAEDQVAWRAGRRYAARLGQAPLREAAVPPGIPPARREAHRDAHRGAHRDAQDDVQQNGAYVVTVGPGALGRRVTRHLAERGAGRIVVGDHDGPAGRAARLTAALRRAGADIELVHGDIADPATAPLLVSAATATGLPLRGVAHAAGVTVEAPLTHLDDDLLDRVWAPRTAGAWHLLRAVDDRPLDWWLSFSSAAALTGSPGHGACAAADGWLDAFTAHGRAHGVPAHNVTWGTGTAADGDGARTRVTSSSGAPGQRDGYSSGES